MKKILIASLFASLFIAGTASAQTPTFPIAELGNCESKEACRVYCDISTNKEACVAYAEKVGLFNKAKAAAARVLIKKEGPGGCSTPLECRAFCAQVENKERCFAFAVKQGLRSQTQADNVLMRIRAKMASSSPDWKPEKGSTTRMMPANVKPITPEMKERMMNASGTKPLPPGINKQMPPRPPKSASTTPTTFVPRTGLGAAVANFLEFLRW